MKKNLLIILINIFLLLFLLAILETYSYKSIFVTQKLELPNYKKFDQVEKEFLVDNHLYTNYSKPTKLNQLIFENDGRSLVGNNYKNKKPILLIGCSYTYGLGLKKEQTFGYQLSELTKRPVHNWAWKTESVDYAFLQSKNKENIKKLEKNPPEYIIYTYMYDHPARLIGQHRQYRWHYLRKYGVIDTQKYSAFDNSYTVSAIKNKQFEKQMKSGDLEENLTNYIFNLLCATKNEYLKHFPNAKFVILLYLDTPENIRPSGKIMSSLEYNILYSQRWKELEKEGFIVVSTKDLINRTMDKPEDILTNDYTATAHPTQEIWHKLTVSLSKKLKL